MSDKAIKVRLHNAETIKKFVQVVRGFMSDVDIMTEHAILDAKSIMGLYALDLYDDTYVKLISDNINELREFDAAMEEFK